VTGIAGVSRLHPSGISYIGQTQANHPCQFESFREIMTASRNRKWWLAMRTASRWLPAVARTSGIVLLTIVIVFAVFRATAPFLISSGLVRSGIEKALSDWTGYRAQIEGDPTLEFWPTPRVTLNQVSIREPTAHGKVLGHVDSLSADFSLFAALRGRAHFHE